MRGWVATSSSQRHTTNVVTDFQDSSKPVRWTVIAGLVTLTAFWGVIVDANVIPLLDPTQNSTIFQASTAAPFALLGILFGPGVGALAGTCRDTFIYIEQVIANPSTSLHLGLGHYVVKWLVDAVEDALLGFIPGLVALRTRRLGLLVLASAAGAWLSLPFLTIGYTLNDGHPGQIWRALTTAPGDWNEPVDTGLSVYALLVGALVALALARWTSRPRVSLAIGVALAAGAVFLMTLGGHA